MIILLSTPLQGWIAPLEEVDDPVFSQRMAGDGVAIDPTDCVVYAPCDAEILSVAPTRHAVTLRGPGGIEILIHIGLDTVALNGEGFSPHVEAGQKVLTGERLLSFDLDQVGRRARSLLTPILITNLDAFQVRWRQEGRGAAVGDPLLQVTATTPTRERSTVLQIAERRVTLGLDQGLHARPSARVGALLKPFSADVHLEVRGRKVSAKSLISLMTLQATKGDEVRLLASGQDRDRALEALADFLGAAEIHETAPSLQAGGSPGSPTLPPSDHAGPGRRIIRGVRAAPGQALGPAAQLRRRPLASGRPSMDQAFEMRALEQALDEVRDELGALAAAGGIGGQVMSAHLGLLEDPDLRASAHKEILAGRSAGSAFQDAINAQSARLDKLDQPHLRARVADLKDLLRRVSIRLSGEDLSLDPLDIGEGSILLADDLSPSELLILAGRIQGLCTSEGGPTSHLAIIAASLNLPMVAAAGKGVLSVADGALVIVNGDRGELILEPAEEAQEEARTRPPIVALDAEPCRMADGTRIEIFANLAGLAGASAAVRSGAEGCGLLRTEFLFMDRDDPPDEAEQRAAYQAILEALGGRPLTIRTFDYGGDKPLRFLPGAKEDNPALGLRGVRTSLLRPDLLRPQLRAMLQLVPQSACRILAPMVTSIEEVIELAAILDEERRALRRAEAPKLGVMIETPAAALLTEAIGEHADFFSIGSNDLTQYALAMDRAHAGLAAFVDPLHPSVLRLMALACDGAAKAGRTIGVCGAVGSDPMAAAVLIGLGVAHFSASPSAIASLKAAVRPLTLQGCQALAKRALALNFAADVHALLAAPAPSEKPLS